MPLFFYLDFTVGLEQCWAVIDFHEELLVPVPVPHKMEFWVWFWCSSWKRFQFWKSDLVELELAVLTS
jgi:hypothetical protein